MRLTKTIREDILSILLGRAFDGKFVDLNRKLVALGKEVYDHLLPKEVQEKMADLCKFDKNAFHKTSSISVCGPGRFYEQIPMCLEKQNSLPIPYSWYCSTPINFEGKEDLFVRIQAAYTEQKELREKRAETKTQIIAVLGKATTTDSLKKQWPEISVYIEEIEKQGRPKQNLPAIVLDDINKLCGLPPKLDGGEVESA